LLRGTEAEFEHAARDVDGAGKVALGELVRLAHVDQRIGLTDRLFRFLQIDFMDMGLGLGDQIVRAFHRRNSCERSWIVLLNIYPIEYVENALKRRTGEIREWLPKRWRVSAPLGGGDAAAQSA